MRRLLILAALAFSLVGTESCKTTVATRPQQPAVVARPPRPRPNYVWIDGEWYVAGGKYQYRQGYWAPPHKGGVWVPGHWEKRRGGWYWQKGHWR